MKNISIFGALLSISLFAHSQTYTPADAGSKVHFVIRNFGFKVGGDFTGLKGIIVFNPGSLATSKFNVTVDAKTINTDISARDSHLRKPEYFDVEKYPLIRFASTKITNSTIAGRYYVFGNLTIKGVTKAIEFGFGAIPSANGYVFNGEFEIDRRDFGVGGSSMSLSDKLKVSLSVVAKK